MVGRAQSETLASAFPVHLYCHVHGNGRNSMSTTSARAIAMSPSQESCNAIETNARTARIAAETTAKAVAYSARRSFAFSAWTLGSLPLRPRSAPYRKVKAANPKVTMERPPSATPFMMGFSGGDGEGTTLVGT